MQIFFPLNWPISYRISIFPWNKNHFPKKNENFPRQKFPKYSYENKNSYRIHLILRFKICPIESDIITQTKNVPLIRPLLIRQTIVAFITAKGGNKYRQVNQTDFTGEGAGLITSRTSKLRYRKYKRACMRAYVHTVVYTHTCISVCHWPDSVKIDHDTTTPFR